MFILLKIIESGWNAKWDDGAEQTLEGLQSQPGKSTVG